MTLAEGAVRHGGVTLHAARGGGGPRVLVLHGGPGLDHHTVIPLAAALDGAAEVWLPDLPGHGASRRRGQAPPSLDAVVEITARWVESANRPWGGVVGHSLGAWLAVELMRRGRLRPAAAVLLAPPGPAAACRSGRGPVPPGPARRRSRDVEVLRRELLELAAEDAGRTPSAAFAECVGAARLLSPGIFDVLRRQLYRRLLEPPPPWRPPCPVLVLAGASDRIAPPERVRRVAASIVGATGRELPGGHFPFAVDDDAAGPAVREFLLATWRGEPGPDQAARSSTQ